MDFRDEHHYEPPLISLLNRLYWVLKSYRNLLATGLFVAGVLFLMQWQALDGSTYQGYPALGFPLMALAGALIILPVTTVTTTLLWHVRLREEYLGFRDLHWLQSMVEKHPALEAPCRPYLESRSPVPVDALRKIWPQLVQAAEEHE